MNWLKSLGMKQKMRKNDVMTAACARAKTSAVLYHSVIEHLGDFILPGVNEKIEDAVSRGETEIGYRLSKEGFVWEDAATLGAYLEALGYFIIVYPEDTEDESYLVSVDWR